MLLTRLPMGRWGVAAADSQLTDGLWAFPLVGLVVNGGGGAVYWLGHRLGMPAMLAAAWSLAAMALLTGALHEDGLADTADGFGGGATRSRKLEIMRDSRIGSYGALALIFSVSVRLAALGALAAPGSVLPALLVAGTLGRGAILLLLLALPAARTEGMGAAIGAPAARPACLGLALAVIASLALVPLKSAILAILVASAAALLLAYVARRQIGGHTGDVLGAGELLCECAVLSLLAGCLPG